MYTATKWIIGGAGLLVLGMYLVAALIAMSDGGFEIRAEVRSAVMVMVIVLALSWVLMHVVDVGTRRSAERDVRDVVAAELQRQFDSVRAGLVAEAVQAFRQIDAERTEEIHVRVFQTVKDHTNAVLDQVRMTLAAEVREQLGQVKGAGTRRGLAIAADFDAERIDRGIASVHVLRSGTED